MKENGSSREGDDIDWNTDDELEIFSSSSSGFVQGAFGEASSSNSKMSDLFSRMGFPLKFVLKAIKQHGEDDEGAILDSILTYMALENDERNHVSNDPRLSECGSNNPDELSDVNSVKENKVEHDQYFETMKLLEEMGYDFEDALSAIDRCGLETPIDELVEFIDAAHMAEEDDLECEELPNGEGCHSQRKAKKLKLERGKSRRNQRQPMIGFGLPNGPTKVLQREIPAKAKGPPYFYYENVACTLKGVWEAMSRSLYEIEPEVVDSIHFSVAARKRGYIHNLPLENRFQLVPVPPQTIQETFPSSTQWWPAWDKRTKLNCICIRHGSAEDTRKIKEMLDKSGTDPPQHVKKYVLEICRKYNFIWVGKNRVAPLEPDETEAIMGFPRNHTRGGGTNTGDRYKCLGNAFQVDTVAYHLSVLKKLFPHGIKVLSLFSGIGGAEVALHRLGIPLNFVVSVEVSETCKKILQSWWEQTNQTGELIHISDVKDITASRLQQLMDLCGGFDLVIGGSPCNNLAGKNRTTRTGLSGEQSSLFFDYCEILDLVKKMTPMYRAPE